MHISCDIGCHLFSILPPFNLGNTTMGYGLGAAGASAFNACQRQARHGGHGRRRLLAQRPHRGVGNAVFNQADNVLLIVDNGYSAATGGQDILSSRAAQPHRRAPSIRSPRRCRASASSGCGVIDRTYDLAAHARHAARGHDDAREGPEGDRRGRPNACSIASGASGRCSRRRDRRRRARGARALRRRRRHLHGRPLLHPAVGMPVADASVRTPIRCGRIRSRMSTIPAWAAGCAARWPTPRCCARRSIGRSSCSIRRAGTGCSHRYAARSSAGCNDSRIRGGQAVNTEPGSGPRGARRRRARARFGQDARCRWPLPHWAGRAAGCSPIGSSRSLSVTVGSSS